MEKQIYLHINNLQKCEDFVNIFISKLFKIFYTILLIRLERGAQMYYIMWQWSKGEIV